MILVTGGTGFVGRRLQKYQPQWVYISSKDYDLTVPHQVESMFLDHKNVEAVIHLAGKVGGIKDNANRQAEYYYQNVLINTNVIHQAYVAGVTRLLASLSTCAYPDNLDKYPFTEADFLRGEPAHTNFSYGYAKRMLHVQCQAYRRQYGVNYSTFCPTNIYGEGDNFDSLSSHFVAALITKVAQAKDGDTIELWGTGTPLRQQLYVDDLCEMIPLLLKKHNTVEPLIVAPDENLSIAEMSALLTSQLHKNIKIVYNNKLDGQFRKDGSNQKLKKIIGNCEFTKFKEGVLKTYNEYEKQ